MYKVQDSLQQHCCIQSLRKEVSAHKTSLTTLLLIEVPAPSQKNDRLHFGIVPTISFSVIFIFMNLLSSRR